MSSEIKYLENSTPTLIVVLGATAVGKTATCITLSQHFNAPIVSADSRQIYKEMTIGVAKPTKKERQQAPHHLIDFLSVKSPYSAGEYAKDGLSLLNELFKVSPVAILTGGSGLYIDALCKGLSPIKPIDPHQRKNLIKTYQQEGIDPLLTELESCDPIYFNKVDKKNPKRIMRALEVYRTHKIPFSQMRSMPECSSSKFRQIWLALTLPRTLLYQRINKRVEIMLETGLLEEVKELYKYKDLPALRTIGYQEFFPYIDGSSTLEQSISLTKQNTRHYAKRQYTWMSRYENVRWFEPSDESEIISFIEKTLENKD